MTRRYLRHSTIARHWAEQGAECPFTALRIDAGEPCCFGCGWRTPTPDADVFEGPDWGEWNLVGGLLEKAHLVDHAIAPELDTDPSNLVLLCRRCHRAMTKVAFDPEDYEAAIAFVVARPVKHWSYQIWTDQFLDTPVHDLGNLRDLGRRFDEARDEMDRRIAAAGLAD